MRGRNATQSAFIQFEQLFHKTYTLLSPFFGKVQDFIPYEKGAKVVVCRFGADDDKTTRL
jgi:hypothetical protein